MLESIEHLPTVAQQALVRTLTTALSGVNEAFLMNNRVPRLYQSGVRYENPPRLRSGEAQPWRDVPLILQSKRGTCMELAAWRLAELRFFEGHKSAVPFVKSEIMGNAMMFHVLILDDGILEDPSIALGMGADPWVPFY